MGREAVLGIGTPDYLRRAEAANARHVEIPHVNIYHLSQSSERDAFANALRETPQKTGVLPWKADSPDGIILDALDRGVFVDTFAAYQLPDLATSKRSKDYFKSHPDLMQRYGSLFNRGQYSNVVEFPWKSNQGRFVRILNKEPFYEINYSRNRHLISKEAQEALRKTKFIVAGMGVGTACAYLLALTGAENFCVIDGGVKKNHDSNRLLGSNVGEIGLNHAVSWARMALEANPYMNIECHPQNAGEGNLTLDKLLEGDGNKVFLELTDDLAFKLGARMTTDTRMATDVGFGGVMHKDLKGIPFQGRMTPDVIATLQNPDIDFETKTQIASQVMVGYENIPAHYLKALGQSQESGAPFWPQIGAAAFLSAAMTVTAIMMDLEGEKTNPEVLVDLKKQLANR
ncbi:MAG TPA: ThiF family adenylyltransferase [Patescibacteria group bacterium]|nr:ThiF family adenylyltransferase [Patescibacteria group bacterium]